VLLAIKNQGFIDLTNRWRIGYVNLPGSPNFGMDFVIYDKLSTPIGSNYY